MKKILVIQTAFIGDVILATGILEKLHHYFPESKIDIAVKSGNETLFNEHPFLNHVFCFNKHTGKLLEIIRLIRIFRSNKYDIVINLHRFFSSGIMAVCSGAPVYGFKQNPLSVFYKYAVKHNMAKSDTDKYQPHEIERNNLVIEKITDNVIFNPKLYPSNTDYEKIKRYQTQSYICIAPTSVWYTKQVPFDKWTELIYHKKEKIIYLLGAKTDWEYCENLKNIHPNSINLAGQLSLLQSAALMQGSTMNYVNDSAPLHLCSSVNAPVTVFFCSTIPAFGFTPLSINQKIVSNELPCKPCGIHGHKHCPEHHFNCGNLLNMNDV